MTDLAEAVSFGSGGFTRLADRTAKEGLIRRDPDPGDRRAALAVLTDKGAEALDRAMTQHVSHLRTHVSRPLSATDRRHLERAHSAPSARRPEPRGGAAGGIELTCHLLEATGLVRSSCDDRTRSGAVTVRGGPHRPRIPDRRRVTRGAGR
ncbi:MarR family winged helix-turn-helix transcriptional regulator [Streptomyces collinus]|uniref:MarR family winged helix-turn-helix transcriptional regulator n=1 Tax=Streptomyces collinus TaxID=42684 RepID=UPI00366704C3